MISARAIAFDVGNTLLLNPEPETVARCAPAVAALLEAHDCPFTEDAIARDWLAADARVSYAFASHFLQEEPILQGWLRSANVPGTVRAIVAPHVVTLYREALRELLTERADEGAYADLADMLNDFRDRGLRVGILSNDREFATDAILGWMGLADAFDFVVNSERVGAEKPDPTIFAELVEAAGSAPGEIIYVGDDLSRDVAGGRAAGLVVVLYKPPEAMRVTTAWQDYTTGAAPAAVIEDLLELREMVSLGGE